jgi:hypothetical protein
MHANNELVARSAYQAVSGLLKRGELGEARAEVSRLDAIDETSVYHARALELRKAIEAGLISHLLDRGDEALKRRAYSEAKALANEVLALDPSNRGGRRSQGERRETGRAPDRAR